MLYDSKNTEMTVQQAVKIMRGLRNWQNHVYEPHIIDQAIRVVVDTAESTLCNAHPFIGKYAIARCYAAGVHAGEVSSVNGENAILKHSNRLWNWNTKDGIALSGVAQNGITSGCKVDTTNPEIYLTGVCELIPCSNVAMDSIYEYKK